LINDKALKATPTSKKMLLIGSLSLSSRQLQLLLLLLLLQLLLLLWVQHLS